MSEKNNTADGLDKKNNLSEQAFQLNSVFNNMVISPFRIPQKEDQPHADNATGNNFNISNPENNTEFEASSEEEEEALFMEMEDEFLTQGTDQLAG